MDIEKKRDIAYQKQIIENEKKENGENIENTEYQIKKTKNQL